MKNLETKMAALLAKTFFSPEFFFVDELWKFNLQLNPILHIKFIKHRNLWQERLLFLACLNSLFCFCQFLKVYPRDQKILRIWNFLHSPLVKRYSWVPNTCPPNNYFFKKISNSLFPDFIPTTTPTLLLVS